MPLRQPANNPDVKRRVLRAAWGMAPRAPAVVEVGTMRYAAESDDGRSTLFFGGLARAQGGWVHSVDTDPRAVEVAAEAARRAGLREVVWVQHGDGEGFLARFKGTIDLLYLDGGDDPRHALAQLEAAAPKLSRAAVLLVDDCHAYGGHAQGKGTLALPRARELGFEVRVLRVGRYAMGLGLRRRELRQRLWLAWLGLRLAITHAREPAHTAKP